MRVGDDWGRLLAVWAAVIFAVGAAFAVGFVLGWGGREAWRALAGS